MCNTCGCKSAEEINPVDSYVVDAPLGRGVAQFYSEGGESAVYEPSNEPMGATPATEPTNENPVLFCADCGSKRAEGHGCGCTSAYMAQGYDDKMDESLGMRHRGKHQQSMKDRRDEASAMDKGHSHMHRKYDDVMTMDSQGYDDKMDESLGMRHRGKHQQSMKDRRDEASAMDKGHSHMHRKYDDVMTMDAESKKSKSMFTKDKRGRMYARNRRGQIITHNAENESAVYEPSSEPMGATPATEPTNENPNLFGAESSPSSFDIRWEDMEGLSSPSLPPEGIHFAEYEAYDDEISDRQMYLINKLGGKSDKSMNRSEASDYIKELQGRKSGTWRSEFVPNGDGRAIGSQTFEYNGTPLHAEGLDDYTPMDSVVVDKTSYQPAQDYGADFTLERPFRTGAYASAGVLFGATLFGVVGMTLANLVANFMGMEE